MLELTKNIAFEIVKKLILVTILYLVLSYMAGAINREQIQNLTIENMELREQLQISEMMNEVLIERINNEGL